MRNTGIYLCALALFSAMASCSEKKVEKEAVNSRGVPMSIDSLIMGDSYLIDTLYSSDQHTYIYINNPEFTQHIIYGDEGVIINSPTVGLDSIGNARYRVTDILGSTNVDFSRPESVALLKMAFPTYKEFYTVLVSDTTSKGQKAVYAYAVDVPRESMVHSKDISPWLEKCIDDSVNVKESFKILGEKLGKSFFDEFPESESQFTYTDSRSMLVYVMTPDYVTYQDYYFGYRGGAHGMYANRFISYNLAENRPVTYDNTFVPGAEEEIRELIYESLAADDEFMEDHKLTSLSQVKTYIANNLMGDPLPIPAPGLLKDGMVFCYQPYEIAPYSDGALQIVVPYGKINEFLLRKNP